MDVTNMALEDMTAEQIDALKRWTSNIALLYFMALRGEKHFARDLVEETIEFGKKAGVPEADIEKFRSSYLEVTIH